MATNTIKRLGTIGNLTASYAAYVTATSANTIVKEITLVNHGATIETVEVHIDTTTPADNTSLIQKLTMAVGDTAQFSGNIVVNTGEALYLKTTTAASVSFSAHGMEMT